MARLAGFFAVIPVSVLLTISFFVLLTVRKAETQGLKAFGFVVAAVLWFASLVVFSTGIYILSTGRMPFRYMMRPMMCEKMQMMKQCGGMPAMMQPGMDNPVMKR
jgi:hypothetical protein